jgi:hypothetical protein
MDRNPKAREGHQHWIPRIPKCAECQHQGVQYRESGDADTECYQITMPVTQQQSV